MAPNATICHYEVLQCDHVMEEWLWPFQNTLCVSSWISVECHLDCRLHTVVVYHLMAEVEEDRNSEMACLVIPVTKLL